MSSKLKISVIENTQELRASEKLWADIAQHARATTVFMSWEWHCSWWETFNTRNDKLQLLVVYDQDVAVGLAPFYLKSTRLSGRVLRFTGNGETETDEVVTEYSDLLAKSGYEKTVVDAVAGWIESNSQWRSLFFECVLHDSLCSQMCELLASKYTASHAVNGFAYSVPLGESAEDYRENQLSASRNKRLKRCLKSLEKDGGGLQRTALTDAAEIEHYFSALTDLHNERWSAKKTDSIFESSRFVAFHKKVIERLLPQQKASIVVYSLNDKPMASIYLFHSDTSTHYYQSGNTRVNENRYMPLFVSHFLEMNVSREAGREHYDFMRGHSDSYKSDYGCVSSELFDRVIYRYKLEKIVQSKVKALRRFVSAFIKKSALISTD